MLVEPGVDTHIVCSHLLFGKFLQFLHGSWGSVLETDAVEPLVQVNGVLTGNDLTHGGALALFLALGRHLEPQVSRSGNENKDRLQSKSMLELHVSYTQKVV